ILIGVSGLLNKRSTKFGNILLIVLGIFIQVDKLGLIYINIWNLFWPIILISIGFKIIFSKGHGKVYVESDHGSDHKEKHFAKNITSKDTINEFTLMAGVTTNNQSQRFKGGKAVAIMGGIEIDLRAARLHNNKAMLEINSIMGGVEIYVPDTWRVEVTGTPILGGWSNKTKHNTDPDAPVLRIKGFVLLGGVEIK